MITAVFAMVTAVWTAAAIVLLVVVFRFLDRRYWMKNSLFVSCMGMDGDAERVESLLARNPSLIRTCGYEGLTALHYAVMNPDRLDDEFARLLIAHGADVRATDDSGFTPLHIASGNGNAAAVRTLLANGADPNAASKNGMTPAMFAATREDILSILEAHGTR